MTTEGASTLPIAQVKGLKNTCHNGLFVSRWLAYCPLNLRHNKSGERSRRTTSYPPKGRKCDIIVLWKTLNDGSCWKSQVTGQIGLLPKLTFSVCLVNSFIFFLYYPWLQCLHPAILLLATMTMRISWLLLLSKPDMHIRICYDRYSR